MSESIYAQIGGAAGVDRAVDIFYRKVLADPRINAFFDSVDMERQAAKQKSFITMALGGPNSYTGRDMRIAHAHLVARGLNDGHFDAVVENLAASLEELDVPRATIDEIGGALEGLRADVLGR
ncbi:MAG: group 1 truncated hemoglobin [Nannocystaceae bacterium]